MTKKNPILALALVVFLTISSVTFAAFPVKKDAPENKVELKDSKGTQVVTEFKSELSEISTSDLEQTSADYNSPMDEEQIIALVLWFFLGGLAAHRWYAGKSALSNILFILTGGGCGIWAIIDLVKILNGSFF